MKERDTSREERTWDRILEIVGTRGVSESRNKS